MGPIDPVSVDGASYYLLVKDDTTGYRIVFCISRKSDTLTCIQQAVHQVLRDTYQNVKVLHTDRGGEFVSKAATKFYDDSLIRHELTTPYNPEQNGAAERENCIVMELVRSMIHSRQVLPKFWAEATHTAVYVLNRILSRILIRTPFESWYHRKPSLSHLRTFGCPAFIYTEKHTRTKLDSKSRPGIFMGHAEESKAYHV
jgi:transposase InsO family protein